MAKNGSVNFEEDTKLKVWRSKYIQYLTISKLIVLSRRDLLHKSNVSFICLHLNFIHQSVLLSNTNEAEKRKTVMLRMEADALGPERIEKIKTTDHRDKRKYIPFATLRLQELDALVKKGSTTSKGGTKEGLAMYAPHNLGKI